MKQEAVQTFSTRRKRRWGDRNDGWLVKDTDPLHIIMPYMFPNRCDNEAFIQEQVDLTPIRRYLDQKNQTNPHYPYKLFQLLIAAMVKTFVLRPKMNRFIQGGKTFQRNELSVAFVIKKQFSDEGGEAIAYIQFDENDTLETVRDKIYKVITDGRSEKMDGATQSLTFLANIPRFIVKTAVRFLNWLEYHGHYPKSFANGDPCCASVFITNLGSIRLKAGYHHLTNRGTNSVFVIIGETHTVPVFDDRGKCIPKEVVDVGITLDERIADGYYYSKSIQLVKYLLSNPHLLELPAKEEVPYDPK